MLRSIFKKLLLCLLILALLPINALAENWFSALFGNANSPQLRFVSVREKAFSTENARVIAAAGDGSRVLITNAYELYLWDVKANKRIPLRLTDEEDIELFNFTLESAFVLRSATNREQRETMQKRYEEVRDSYFKQHGLDRFTSFDEMSECFPMRIAIGARTKGLGQRYALIEAVQFGAQFIADLQTGECRFVENQFASLYGDKLLDLDNDGITQIETGEVYLPNYSLPDAQVSMGYQKDIKLLSDDSIAILIPEAEMTENYERNMHLRLASTKNGFDVVLGQFRAMTEPDTLLPLGNGKYVAAFSRNNYRNVPTFIVNCETSEVMQLEPDKLMMVSATEDSFILYNTETYSYDLVELNPETLEQTALSVSGANGLGFTALASVVTNGEGLYFVQGDILHGYFELVK